MNGDGFAEIIAGPGAGGGPHVRVFSGATGQPLREFFAYSTNFTGGVRVGTVDGNGDGRLDLLLGPGAGGGPHVRVLDFQTLGSVREFLAYSANFTGGVFVAGSKNGTGGSPQLAASGQAIASADAPAISDEDLQPLLSAAIDRWRAAGVDADALARLNGIDVHVADLPDGHLGLAFPAAVYIDVNAAGHGWFIDATPSLDEEFVGPLASGANRVDLLSTIMHELGHVLGLEDLYGEGDDDEVMYGLLEAGVRRTPQSAVDAIFSDEDWK